MKKKKYFPKTQPFTKKNEYRMVETSPDNCRYIIHNTSFIKIVCNIL